MRNAPNPIARSHADRAVTPRARPMMNPAAAQANGESSTRDSSMGSKDTTRAKATQSTERALCSEIFQCYFLIASAASKNAAS